MLVLILLLSGWLIFVYGDLVEGVRSSVGTWTASINISRALDNAASVTLIEFDDSGDRIRVAAGPKEVAELRRATNRWLVPSENEGGLCFDPHHRVDVVRADGSEFHFVICFECRNFQLEPSLTTITDLPNPWRKSLTALFKSKGMSPWNSDDPASESKTPQEKPSVSGPTPPPTP